MSFLGDPFRYDQFISYSHGAFAGVHDSELKRWSQKFAADLRAELAGTIEFEQFSMFLDESERSDESVDRTADLPEHLQQRVAESALLTILMTPHYLRSDWCRQEREWWFEKHQPDTHGTIDRIFFCRVRPTDQESWPSELPEAIGYHCYDKSKEPDKARPYTWRGSGRDLDDYNDLLVDLSGDMMQRLRAIKEIINKQEQREKEEQRLAADAGQVLYLHARDAHADAWQSAGGALSQIGFVVLPGQPDSVPRDPKVAQEVAELRVQTLSVCDGLLLLGTEDGRALDADLVVVGRRDRHSARDRSERLLPCAVLDTVGPDIATPERLAAARGLGIHWIDTTKNIWSDELRGWLVEASAVAAYG